jgi:archaemetzincin
LEKIRATLGSWPVLFVLWPGLSSAAVIKAERMVIEIVPLGKIDDFVLKNLQKNLAEVFQAKVSVGEEGDLPEDAFDARRKQYLSLPILLRLTESRKQEGQKILGVMDEDVYTPGLNFIFGQADSAAGVALISLKRLRQSFYGIPEKESLFFERTLKEAVHEIGHLLNLGHCSDPRCVMHFSNSLADTDRKGYTLCPACQKRLK